MMRCLLPLLLLLATPAAAQFPPINGADPRLQTVAYDPGQVVRLRVASGYQTTIALGPGEQIENIAIGDGDAWQVTPNNRGDHLFIKPLRVGSVTNLTVVTGARLYSFELTAVATPTPDAPFAVRFQYPDDQAAQPAAADLRRYRISGARALRPDAISDDGVRTSIAWKPDQSLPAVFAVDDQGQEVLLDGQMRDGRYVIDAVHETLVFRLDRQTARAARLRAGARR